MQNVKVVARFSKSGFMRYISHLDFVRLTYRMLRRADLPYVLTGGFNRRPKVKFGPALKLGRDGEIEVTFFLSAKIDLQAFRQRIEQQLTEGIRIVEINYGE